MLQKINGIQIQWMVLLVLFWWLSPYSFSQVWIDFMLLNYSFRVLQQRLNHFIGYLEMYRECSPADDLQFLCIPAGIKFSQSCFNRGFVGKNLDRMN